MNAPAGTTYQLTEAATVTIIDPFKEYIAVLKTCFDFEALRKFAKRPEFSLLFDAMHGAGGPFARKVFLEELGLPEVRRILSQRLLQWARVSVLTFIPVVSLLYCAATLDLTLASATLTRTLPMLLTW